MWFVSLSALVCSPIYHARAPMRAEHVLEVWGVAAAAGVAGAQDGGRRAPDQHPQPHREEVQQLHAAHEAAAQEQAEDAAQGRCKHGSALVESRRKHTAGASI